MSISLASGGAPSSVTLPVTSARAAPATPSAADSARADIQGDLYIIAFPLLLLVAKRVDRSAGPHMLRTRPAVDQPFHDLRTQSGPAYLSPHVAHCAAPGDAWP